VDRWEGTFRSLMKFWSGHVGRGYKNKEEELDSVLVSCSVFLDLGSIGSRLYDLTVLMLSDTPKASDTLLVKIEEFITEVSVKDFCLTVRHVLLNKRFRNNVGNSTLMSLVTLILTGYNRGMFIGLYSDNPVFLDSISVLEYELSLVLKLHELGLRSMLHPNVRLSPKQITKFKTYLYRKDKQGVLSSLRDLTKEKVIDLFNKCTISLYYAYSTHVYLEQTSSCILNNSLFSYITWEREETTSGQSSVYVLFRSILSEDFCGDDVLKTRNIYVRDKGVSIRFIKPQDEVTRITLREYHNFTPYEEHYLLVNYYCGEVKRFIPVDMTSIESSFKVLMYEKDAIVLLMVFKWLGILDKLDLSLDHFMRVYDHLDEDQLFLIRSNVITGLRFFDEVMSEENFVYEEPYQWNSFPEEKARPQNHKGVYVLENRHIGRYTRKLPAGQQASTEAKALATSVFIELEEGMTLVDEFERKQRVSLGSMKTF
jgi:hypothetical protein